MKNEKSKFLVPQCLSALAPFKKSAFTLAEVLITLAIIGVVAAMTIPTLISNYKEKVTVTKIKNFYSYFSNAYQLAKVDHGPISQWGVKNIEYQYDEDGKNIGLSQEDMDSRENIIKNMQPYLKTVKYLPFKSKSGAQDQGWFFKDGLAMVWLWYSKEADFYIATDGLPMRHDNMTTYKENQNLYKFWIDDNKVYPAGYNNEEFKEYCLTGVDPTYCTGWIIRFGNMEYKRCNDLDMVTKNKCD